MVTLGGAFAPIGLALCAAFAFAIATVLQHARARHHTEAARDGILKRWLPVLAGIGPLLRDPIWQLGWLVSGLGFALHAAALNYGPIAVVQAVLVVQLLLAIVIGDLRRHVRPSIRDCLAATAVILGVVLVIVQRADAGRRVDNGVPSMIFLACGAAAVVAMLGLARLTSGRTRGILVGIAAGTCFTGTAINLTLLTSRLAELGLPGLAHWTLAALAVTTVGSVILVQDALASGELAPPLTAMTVADPLIGVIAGALLFDVAPPSQFQLAVGLPAAGVLIAIGVAFLATTSTLQEELGQAAADEDVSDAWSSTNFRTVSDQG